MARHAPIQDGAEIDSIIKAIEDQSQTDWQIYQCKLVTPMYGGGVEPGVVDTEMPIRASTIRGQLRFWWRIACAQGLTAKEMFARETAIWGGIGENSPTASKVEVRVVCKTAGASSLAPSTMEIHAAIKYAFGSAAINGACDWLETGYEFQLMLRYPDEVAEEVGTTLAWWASFGGLGARTRRGFGAIQIDDVPLIDAKDVEKAGGRLQLIGSGSAKADTEWKIAVDRLFSFRQKGGIARKANTPRPGRSFWPEPDQIRRFTKRNANGKHDPVHVAGNVFPRAAFGLPITFEFKGTPGDPSKLELHPAGDGDRMASPLILRPYWNGEKWQPAALLLPGWEKALSQPLKFKGQSYQPAHWPTDPEQRKKLAADIPPMANRAADPLSAFMQFFAEGK